MKLALENKIISGPLVLLALLTIITFVAEIARHLHPPVDGAKA